MSLYAFGKETAGQLLKVARREGLRARGATDIEYPDLLSWFFEVYVGQTTASHAKGAAQAVNRFQPTAAIGTAQVTSTTHLEDSTNDDTVMNLFANISAANKWVIYIRIFYSFYLISAEC